MSDGGYTRHTAMRLQAFTGRIKCEAADQYGGRDAPRCLPVCECCLLKWMEEISPECKPASVSSRFPSQRKSPRAGRRC